MPTISGKTTVPAAGRVDNILLGSQYELSPADGTIEIGIQSDRLTTTCAIFSGPDVLQEPGGQVPFTTNGTQTMPRYPDDYHWEDEVARGDRLKVTLLNGDAVNPAIVNWILRFTPA